MHPADHLADVAGHSMAEDADLALAGYRALLRLAGEDPDRPGLADTPMRALRGWLELVAQPGDPADLLAVQFPDAREYDEMIAVGPVPFASVCEHHLLPFTGNAWVAYIPNGSGVVGLSKLARLVHHHAKRPQVQERLTTAITDDLEHHLAPLGAACVVVATHTCMTLRGVRSVGTEMTTSRLTGAFKTKPEARAEFLALAQR